MLSILLAMLRLLSERTGLRAARYVLVTIGGPQVTGLRIVVLVVAAMDHLLHTVLEFEHQVPERHGIALTIIFCILTLLVLQQRIQNHFAIDYTRFRSLPGQGALDSYGAIR